MIGCFSVTMSIIFILFGIIVLGLLGYSVVECIIHYVENLGDK